MSEEEKKAIEDLKEEINRPVEVREYKFDTFILYNIKNAKIILNLIEKQQAELDSYNNLKQIEQEHKKINGELREELKRERETSHFLQSQLDIANANIIHLKIAKEESEELLENSVSKDKIREKIEEVKSLENASIADILESEKEFCIDILEELL